MRVRLSLVLRLVVVGLPALALWAGCAEKIDQPTVSTAGPMCSLSSDVLAFGIVTLGQSTERTFTITNSGGGVLAGTVTVRCTDFSLIGGGTFALGNGQGVTFRIRFTPSSVGSKSCIATLGNLACSGVSCSGVAHDLGQQP